MYAHNTLHILQGLKQVWLICDNLWKSVFSKFHKTMAQSAWHILQTCSFKRRPSLEKLSSQSQKNILYIKKPFCQPSIWTTENYIICRLTVMFVFVCQHVTVRVRNTWQNAGECRCFFRVFNKTIRQQYRINRQRQSQRAGKGHTIRQTVKHKVANYRFMVS